MMLIKTPVFRRNDGMLEIERDLAQWNELVSFMVGRVVNPGLQLALHVNCGGRRVDPPRSHKNHRSKRPKECRSNKKPSNQKPEKPLSRLGFELRFGLCVRSLHAFSEYWFGLELT